MPYNCFRPKSKLSTKSVYHFSTFGVGTETKIRGVETSAWRLGMTSHAVVILNDSVACMVAQVHSETICDVRRLIQLLHCATWISSTSSHHAVAVCFFCNLYQPSDRNNFPQYHAHTYGDTMIAMSENTTQQLLQLVTLFCSKQQRFCNSRLLGCMTT